MKRRIKTIPSLRAPAARIRAGGEIEGFDVMVDELSAAMARAPAEAVDGKIKDWLEKICLALDLDRSAVYQRDAPGSDVRASHTWVRPSFPPFPRKFDLRKVKSATDWAFAGNELIWSRPGEIPSKWKDVRQFVERYGPISCAIFPIWA